MAVRGVIKLFSLPSCPFSCNWVHLMNFAAKHFANKHVFSHARFRLLLASSEPLFGVGGGAASIEYARGGADNAPLLALNSLHN